jgi:hypothetical protein
MPCTLCHKAPRTKGHTVCASCAEAISRVMTITAYDQGRQIDMHLNGEQSRILLEYAAVSRIRPRARKASRY